MEKLSLEKRIEERARERFDKEYNNFLKFNLNNKLASQLKLIFIGNNGIEQNIPLFNFKSNYALFRSGIVPIDIGNTNYKELKEKIIKEFIEEETDILLKNLEDIKFFLNLHSKI